MSRRDLWRVLGSTAALIGAYALLQTHVDRYVEEKLDPAPSVVSYAEAARGYGSSTTIWDGELPITVTIGATGSLEELNDLRAGEPERTESWDRVETLEEILGSTPEFYAERCGVSDIRLVEEPRYRTRRVDGQYLGPSSVYLNVSSSDFERIAIHELAHACAFTNLSEDDPFWEPFIATEGTVDPRRYALDDEIEGFARAYGATNRHEDFATMSEDVLVRTDVAESRSARDPVYARKAEAVRTFYSELGHPAFQDE